jgi:AmmeMemoRadiSam system protein A
MELRETARIPRAGTLRSRSVDPISSRAGGEEGRVLLAHVREAIWTGLGKPVAAAPRPEWLAEPGAAFVTLRRDGKLRGCIGSIQATRALGEDVRQNARAAAFGDPRFPPLQREELSGLQMEVSVLSPLQPLPVESEADALTKLRPGVDGVVLSFGSNRGTFLPFVWDELPAPADFLRQLKRKAGLPVDFWDPGIRFHRFTVKKFREEASDGGWSPARVSRAPERALG